MFKKLKGITLEYWIIWICVIIALCFTFWILGCESETASLLDPQKKVNRSEATSEFEILVVRYKSQITNLDQMDAIKNFIMQQLLIIAQNGSINPVGLIVGIGGIFGIGFAADDVRLRKERKKQLSNGPAPNK